MMRQRSDVGIRASVSSECHERALVQPDASLGRDRLLDRQSGKLVPKRDARALRGQDARSQALIETVDELARERIQQRQLELPGNDRDGVEQPPRRRRQARGPCKHCVAHTLRDLLASRREHLGDEERVAARAAVQLLGIDSVRAGQLRDRSSRQRIQLHPPGAAHQLSQHEPKLVRPVKLVVTIAGQQQRGS
jgi:hypothetical protein